MCTLEYTVQCMARNIRLIPNAGYDLMLQEIEPMDKESDHVQMMALSSATGICLRVFCMERGQASSITIPSDGTPLIHLLYRPGHYDILYPDSQGSA